VVVSYRLNHSALVDASRLVLKVDVLSHGVAKLLRQRQLDVARHQRVGDFRQHLFELLLVQCRRLEHFVERRRNRRAQFTQHHCAASEVSAAAKPTALVTHTLTLTLLR
jgi:hypothetical protein